MTSMLGLLVRRDDISTAAEISTITLGSLGAGFIVISVPLLGTGYHIKHNTYKVYNNYCTSSQHTPMSLNFKADQDGFGFALHF